MRKFLRLWWAWLHPVSGWRLRYRRFKAGQTVWPVPGAPQADPVCPWPVEWIPHRLDPSDPRGFVFLDSTCAETGVPIRVGVGCRCLRCGIDLHPNVANQVSHFDPPRCRRCNVLLAV